MPRYVVGEIGFDYDDEYYSATDGIEDALAVCESLAEARAEIRRRTLDVVRNGDKRDLLECALGAYGVADEHDDDELEINWFVLSDDEVIAKLDDLGAVMFMALEVKG